MEDSRESITLRNCSTKLKLAIKINLNDIAQHLYGQDVLLQEVYRAVTDPRSRDRPEERVEEVFNALTDAVQQDEDKYKTFVEYLRRNPRRYNRIVKDLEKEYEECGILGKGATVNVPKADRESPPNSPVEGKEPDKSSGILKYVSSYKYPLMVLLVLPVAISVGSIYLVEDNKPISTSGYSHIRSMDSKPLLKEMHTFQTIHNSDPIYIIRSVSADCNTLGYQLISSADAVNNEWNDGSRVEDKCNRIIGRWLKGMGRDDFPITWRTFIKALRKIQYHALADELEKSLTN